MAMSPQKRLETFWLAAERDQSTTRANVDLLDTGFPAQAFQFTKSQQGLTSGGTGPWRSASRAAKALAASAVSSAAMAR